MHVEPSGLAAVHVPLLQKPDVQSVSAVQPPVLQALVEAQTSELGHALVLGAQL